MSELKEPHRIEIEILTKAQNLGDTAIAVSAYHMLGDTEKERVARAEYRTRLTDLGRLTKQLRESTQPADPNADTLTAAIVEAAKNKADKIIAEAIIQRAVAECASIIKDERYSVNYRDAAIKIKNILEGGE